MKKGLTIVSVLMLIFGIFTLVTGLMSSALLSAGIASVVMQFSVQNLCACVLPLIYFVCAIAVKSSR